MFSGLVASILLGENLASGTNQQHLTGPPGGNGCQELIADSSEYGNV